MFFVFLVCTVHKHAVYVRNFYVKPPSEHVVVCRFDTTNWKKNVAGKSWFVVTRTWKENFDNSNVTVNVVHNMKTGLFTISSKPHQPPLQLYYCHMICLINIEQIIVQGFKYNLVRISVFGFHWQNWIGWPKNGVIHKKTIQIWKKIIISFDSPKSREINPA